MSDINIPGVTTSQYKTAELIQGLMKIERIPRDRAETELNTYKEQQTAWRDVNRHAGNLRETARNLYSFDNPFSEKIASSTDEGAVSATAKRDARFETFKVDVIQVAAADSFLSSELPKDSTVAAGTYTFRVGEKSISFNWRGGNWRDFSDALNRRSDGLIRSSIINTTSRTQAMVIESQKTGATERLSFEDDALAFALQNGFIQKTTTSAINTNPESVLAPPLSTKDVQFSQTARAQDGYMLEITVSVVPAEADAAADSASGELDTSSGSLSYKGITLENIPSETALSAAAAAPPAPDVLDLAVLSLRTSRGVNIPLPPLRDQATAEKLEIPLSEFGDLTSLLVSNKNSNREIRLENIRIYDPKVVGEYSPVNPVSTAQDAIIKYEGITIKRSVNAIEDLVPGVTLNITEPTERTATITVEPDTVRAKESIITFVAQYNRLIAEINILTQDKPEIISEIQYFTDEERESAEKRLAMFQGDTTLVTVKNNLQRITSNAYQNREENPFRMLSELGISTRASAGAGIETSRMRGYLEIDEKILDAALKNRMSEVKDLFGFDTDQDLVIDSGIARAIDQQIQPYVQVGGIFALRTTGLDTRITSTERRIAQLDIQLQDKEDELKRKYGQMEGTLNSLNQQSSAITNFNNQNNNSR